MNEVMVLVNLYGRCDAGCMYGRTATGTREWCSRPTICGAPFGYVYMRPATALHFELTGEVNHALDHNPQPTDTSIVR